MVCGWCAQLVFLAFGIAWLVAAGGASWAYGGFAAMCATWTALVTGFTAMHLRDRNGRTLSPGASYVGTSVRRLSGTLRSVRKDLRQLLIFLLAWFIHSDGAATVGAAATTFAASELRVPAGMIMVSLMTLSVLCIVGSRLAVEAHESYGVRPKTLLLAGIALMGLCPAWGTVMKTPLEYYIASGMYGFAYGGYITFNRSLFSSCIPRGREAEFFGFYEITNKGTSWLGPLMVAWIASASGSYRAAFAATGIFFVLGGAILLCFDPHAAVLERRKAESSAFGGFRELTDTLLPVK